MVQQDKKIGHNNSRIKTIIEISLMVSLGIILQIIEAPLPRPLPWAKLGLANVITLISLLLFSLKEAVFISIIRIALVSILLGTIFNPGFFLSLSGGLMSTFIMGLVLIIFPKRFSLIGVSLIGALVHNMTQLGVAYILFYNQLHISWNNVLYFLPLMLAWAIPTGFIVGYLTKLILPVILNTRKRVNW
ncbi:MAG: Gx transporter family protein [bacterium]|nr:Gx transporter family protein [bacterium]